MSNLPVDAAELAGFEQRLGVRLPEHYVSSLLDPGIGAVLRDRRIGFLRPGSTMEQFGALTEALRARYADFPRDGVLLSCPVHHRTGEFDFEWGYPRFLVPDKKDRTRLGDTVYTWMPQQRRKVRDCTIQEWIASTLHFAGDDVLSAAGVARPPDPWPEQPLRTRPVEAELAAILALRGEAALARLAEVDGQWLPCATLKLKGNWLSVCDLAQFPTGDMGVRLPPGEYAAQVRLAKSRLGEWPIVATLRVTRPGAQPTDRRHAYDVDIDLAAIAVHDRQTLLRRFAIHDRDPVSEQLMALECTHCVVVIRKGLESLVLPSGDGDGSYPVYALLDGDATVGIEVEFVGAQ